MEAFLAALMESLLPSAAEAGGASGMSEAVASGGMAPPSAAESLGSTIGGMGNQAISPTMDAYKTFTNPNATAGDMLQGTYKYAFSPQGKQDEEMMSAPQMRMGGGGMGSNYVGGIPSLLQGYGGSSQGILPYIAGR
tara:strand:- start:131 stop:541 length:411 start_codon:yes stop_codon:yes gene_type:complete